MKTLFRAALAIAFLTAAAATASAGELKLTIGNGLVTLVAKDVTIREILAEWARVGQTRIVNADKLTGGPVTLELTNVPEAQALDTVLRSAAGYVMAAHGQHARPVALRPDHDPGDQQAAGGHRDRVRAVQRPRGAAGAAEHAAAGR
jgi:type II secretory pathway component GspD/PulD (secretin)